MIQNRTGLRYVVPLREGGSLPAVVDTDAGSFVVKFRGAGQGAKALIAELLAAELALALSLAVPAPAVVTLEDGFGAGEPDPEIQDILRGSVGANFGLAYLPGALAFDPAVDGAGIAPELDRTVRNPNLLVWGDRLWLIDHGASLYLHHRWEGWRSRIHSRFPPIRDHVLLPFAGDLASADARLRRLLSEATIRQAVADTPDEWLGGESEFGDLAEHREAYLAYLVERLAGPRDWLQEAIDARRRGPEPLGPRLTHRVV
jgi:hypothetical protein